MLNVYNITNNYYVKGKGNDVKLPIIKSFLIGIFTNPEVLITIINFVSALMDVR